MRGTMLAFVVLTLSTCGQSAWAINHNGFLGFGQGNTPPACYGGQVMQITSVTDRGPNWLERMMADCKRKLDSLVQREPEMSYCMPLASGCDMQPIADPCFSCGPAEEPSLWRRLCNAIGLGPRENTEVAACMPMEMYAGSAGMQETFLPETYSTPTYSSTPMLTVPSINSPAISPTPSGPAYQYEEIPSLRPMPGPVPGAWRQSPSYIR